jgi:hypothetical protein
VELALLFFTLVALGPLVRPWGRRAGETARQPFGLADFPG